MQLPAPVHPSSFIKASAAQPTPLCGSYFISYEGAPLIKYSAARVLCASTRTVCRVLYG